jgi:hypothetical protein
VKARFSRSDRGDGLPRLRLVTTSKTASAVGFARSSLRARGEVSEKLKTALHDLQKRYNIAPQKQTVGQFLNYWLSEIVPGSTKPKTEAFYRYISNSHLIPGLGNIALQKLTPQHVQAFINERLTRSKQYPKPKKAKETAGTAIQQPGSNDPSDASAEIRLLSPRPCGIFTGLSALRSKGR